MSNSMTLVSLLIGQVAKAANGGPEYEVITYISRALWRRFNETLGDHPDTEPTGWLGIGHTHRVYGSETIVVDAPGLWAMSVHRSYARRA